MSAQEIKQLVMGTSERKHPVAEAVGMLVLLVGVIAMALWGVQASTQDPVVTAALRGGLIAAMATAAGAVPVLLARSIGARTVDTLLGFGAGVMLAATAFSLVMPALASAAALGMSTWSSGGVVVAGILLGAGALLLTDHFMPHEHVENALVDNRSQADIARVWLFVAAIALHNVPEGLAIGVGFAQDEIGKGAALAGGIAIQDIPEGLVVAAALVSAGYGRVFAFVVAALTGLAEPVAAVMGASVVGVFVSILPWALAFAAGAMLFVVSHEIIPESQRRGNASLATSGLTVGFALMMLLDTALA
ncbi:ZIP family metal transporter [Nitrogeniibacter aestuarii]|uniref:ZIP family metal transporter n=1 Tax=Nitrogeniibacter aestuarii TaxID=2815343 RepID=UPI001E3796D5|nr:ZIP family metal transporter [Nitrogeniibacter aestuarii]